jgi:hypothetical protein
VQGMEETDTQNFVECITEGINKSNDTGIRC